MIFSLVVFSSDLGDAIHSRRGADDVVGGVVLWRRGAEDRDTARREDARGVSVVLASRGGGKHLVLLDFPGRFEDV